MNDGTCIAPDNLVPSAFVIETGDTDTEQEQLHYQCNDMALLCTVHGDLYHNILNCTHCCTGVHEATETHDDHDDTVQAAGKTGSDKLDVSPHCT